jgi:ammonium transporter
MIVTFIILKVYGSITNIKPKDEDVVKGLDSTLLDEKAYDIM